MHLYLLHLRYQHPLVIKLKLLVPLAHASGNRVEIPRNSIYTMLYSQSRQKPQRWQRTTSPLQRIELPSISQHGNVSKLR